MPTVQTLSMSARCEYVLCVCEVRGSVETQTYYFIPDRSDLGSFTIVEKNILFLSPASTTDHLQSTTNTNFMRLMQCHNGTYEGPRARAMGETVAKP